MVKIEKDLNSSIVFHLIKLAETWKKNGDKLTEAHGITTQQWLILLLLANDPNNMYIEKKSKSKPLLAMELAEAMSVSRANITNLLNVLLAKDLIIQVEDEEDRRRKRLVLSEKGENLINELEPTRQMSNKRVFSAFDEDEKQRFVKFLKICLSKMTKHSP